MNDGDLCLDCRERALDRQERELNAKLLSMLVAYGVAAVRNIGVAEQQLLIARQVCLDLVADIDAGGSK